MEQPRWLNNPRYQKAVQKMARLDPTRKAILDTVIADEAFADQDMRNRLAMMQLAAQKTANQRNLDMGEKRMAFNKERADVGYGLASEKFNIDKSDSNLAENLGYANIGLSGLRGYTDLKEKQRKTKQLNELIGTINKRS